MNDLLFPLIVFGLLVVFAVFVVNRVQEQRFKRKLDPGFEPLSRDPLLGEPAPGGSAPEVSGPDVTELVEPVFGEPPLDDAPRALQPAGAPIDAPMPPCRPALAPIEFRVRIRAEALPPSLFVGLPARFADKPLRLLGWQRHASDWEELSLWSERTYQSVTVCLQLADRGGCVAYDSLPALCTVLGDRLSGVKDAVIDHDATVEAHQRARALDAFCIDVDVLIGLHIAAHAGGSLDQPRLFAEAQAQGLIASPGNGWQYVSPQGHAVFSLTVQTADGQGPVGGYTLMLDVPRAPGGVQAFETMLATGDVLAQAAGGVLVDESGRPLSDAGVDHIRQQLIGLYARMAQQQVAPGSELALRLFS
jgi:hypothetical protein